MDGHMCNAAHRVGTISPRRTFKEHMTSGKHATILPLTREAAWQRYLELTRDVDAADYAETEAEAWDDLQAALERLPARPDDAA
jgi:hypothetical protein